MARLVLLDAAMWAGWSAVVGFLASRVAVSSLLADDAITRIRPIERDGWLYERLRIRRWKDRLPDAGAFFGGQSKRRLPGRTRRDLERFAAETRRAELVHWWILGLTPLFALWNPTPLFAAMVVYGVVANLPCIAIQRYNRGRIRRVLQRRPSRVAA